MKKYLNTCWPFAVIFLTMVIAFWPFFSQGKIPVAGDILLGQYYPWLDTKWDGRDTIFPVLNNTIADSMFSFYPWKYKSVEMIKNGAFPIYDSSTYMGQALFATGTTGILYPLNILFFVLDFNLVWGIIASSTIFLSGSFFYIWLTNKKIQKLPALIVSICYSFSAFIGLQITFINTAHAILWLPLVLLCIDKLFEKIRLRYLLLLVFSLFSSLNAGFFQASLYLFVTSFFYALMYFISKKEVKKFAVITFGFLISVSLSAVQVLPFLETVSKSSRLANYGSAGAQSEVFNFFVEAKFFLTTFFPDFFGNPGKGNYYMQPGYYEFNNFVGTITIIGALIGFTLIKKQKDVLFFVIVLALSVLFASLNPLSKIPYQYSWPVISSLIPARLLSITQFSLLVIAAFGLNWIYTHHLKIKKFLLLLTPLLTFYCGVLLVSLLSLKGTINILSRDIQWDVGFRNSVLPTAVLAIIFLFILAYIRFKKNIFFILILIISCSELIRQTSYFRPFIKPELIYPKTESINFLEKNLTGQRIMITDQDLIPTNSQLVYNLKIVDGEGPIYPKKHGEFLAGINSKDYDEIPEYRRMAYFRNWDTSLLGLLNIKYVVSKKELKNPNLKFVFNEGETKVYENTDNYPRVWTVGKVLDQKSPSETMKTLSTINPKEVAIVENADEFNLVQSESDIKNYSEKEDLIQFNTNGSGKRITVLSEQFSDNWSLWLDGKPSFVFPVNYNLLGFYLPEGSHEIELRFRMTSFEIGKTISISSLIIFGLALIFLKIIANKKRKIN